MGISKSQSLWSSWFRDRSVPFIGLSLVGGAGAWTIGLANHDYWPSGRGQGRVVAEAGANGFNWRSNGQPPWSPSVIYTFHYVMRS